MGEDLSNGARFAIIMIVLAAVVSTVLLIFRIEMQFARAYESRAASAISQSDIAQLRAISDSGEYRTGAVVYTVLSNSYKTIDKLKIKMDGTVYNDYEVLREHTNDLFDCHYGDDTDTGDDTVEDVNKIVFVVTKVGTLNE